MTLLKNGWRTRSERDDVHRVTEWDRAFDWTQAGTRPRPASRGNVGRYWRTPERQPVQPNVVVFGQGVGVEDHTPQLFTELLTTWRNDTRFSSSIREVCAHSAYLKIIGMGSAAIPLIMQDLAAGGGMWGWALAAITRADPTEGTAGSPSEADEAWLSWGRARGLLDDATSAA